MKITNKITTRLRFCELDLGDTFLINSSGCVYMKTREMMERNSDTVMNAICLDTSNFLPFNKETWVERINCELIIKGMQ
jgi:hypothetical protein